MKLKEQIKNIFIDSLERNQYNKTRVSKDLGISIRTVRLWAKKYGVSNNHYKPLTSKQRDIYNNKNWLK